MEHIAIDLGAKESQMCVRSADGEIVDEKRMAARPDKLRRYLAGRPRSRVILETGAEAFWVAEIAREYGHDVRVVASMLAPSLGVGRRGLKSDLRDARAFERDVVPNRSAVCAHPSSGDATAPIAVGNARGLGAQPHPTPQCGCGGTSERSAKGLRCGQRRV